MANAPSAAAQQEPPKAPAPTHALDNLQAMMNLVLISSGRYIKATQAGPDAGRMQFTLKRAVTAANERFHDSLDELENEIHQAQLVLRRDLALLKADRKKREAAAKEKEAEKARLAAESSAKKNVPIKKEEAPAPPTPVKPEPPATSSKPSEPAPEPPSLNRDMDDAKPPAPTTSAPAEDITMENADDSNNANTQDDFDFDALFGDPGDATNDDDLNLDTSGPDLNFTLDDSAPSLLRGLEDFAKSSDDDNAGQNNSTSMDLDFAMPDLPDITANTSSEQPATTKPADDSAAQDATADDDLNIDTMANDNLDDLFNLDYENPEATQFDDAFFGFGE